MGQGQKPFSVDAPKKSGGINNMRFKIPLIRRVLPELFANTLVRVQPMAAPKHTMFHFKYEVENPVPEFAKMAELTEGEY